jgi:N-acetylneuraminic acid mutarotase
VTQIDCTSFRANHRPWLTRQIGVALVLAPALLFATIGCREDAESPTAPLSEPTLTVTSNTWLKRAEMWGIVRYWMATATVPNSAGQSILYVIGGKTESGDSEGYGGSLSKVQAYNVATNTWTYPAPLPKPLYWTNGAGVINGKIYVSGGVASYQNHRPELYMYDPGKNTWTRKRDMPLPAWRGVSGVINNKLYVLPGCTQNTRLDCLLQDPLVFYRYNPVTDQWTSLPPPSQRRMDGVAGVIGGKLYVAGGTDGTYARTGVDVFDPATNQWTSKASMPEGQFGAAGAALRGKLYVIGGRRPVFEPVPWTSVYDPATDAWTRVAPLPAARAAIAASRVMLNGQPRIELVGGLRPGNNLQYIP